MIPEYDKWIDEIENTRRKFKMLGFVFVAVLAVFGGISAYISNSYDGYTEEASEIAADVVIGPEAGEAIEGMDKEIVKHDGK